MDPQATPSPVSPTPTPTPQPLPSDSFAPAQPAVPPKKRFPKWVKIVAGIVAAFVVLLVVLFFVVLAATNAPKKVSDEFVKDLQANNARAAYKLTTSSFKSVTPESTLAEAFSGVSGSLQGKATVSDRKISKTSGSPSQAIIIYTVDTTSGKQYIRIVLQDTSGWQILNFRSSDTPLDTSSAD